MNVRKSGLPFQELVHRPIAETHLYLATMPRICRLKLQWFYIQ